MRPYSTPQAGLINALAESLQSLNCPRGYAVQVRVACILFLWDGAGAEHGMQSLLHQLWDCYHQVYASLGQNTNLETVAHNLMNMIIRESHIGHTRAAQKLLPLAKAKWLFGLGYASDGLFSMPRLF